MAFLLFAVLTSSLGIAADPKIELKLRSELFAKHCKSDASEKIVQPVENVHGILRIDVPAPGRYFIGGIEGFSAWGSTTHPHQMFFRLGLDYIEFELEKEDQTKYGVKYGRFGVGKERNYQYIKSPTTDIAIKFEHIGTPEEEKLGVLGRRISVVNTKTGQVHGVRTEWFANNLGGCPPIGKGQSVPLSFLSRVINPVAYGCWHKTEKDDDFLDRNKRTKAINDCERSYLDRRRK